MNASFPDRSREHWTEPVPPEPNRLVADIDAPLMEQVLDLPQRQRIADIHHHREADYLGRRVEITEGVLHCRRLRNATHWLKPICSDNAGITLQRRNQPAFFNGIRHKRTSAALRLLKYVAQQTHISWVFFEGSSAISENAN